MTVDYHIHALGHGDRKHTKEELRFFVEKAIKNGLREIGFADHDRYINEINLTNYHELSLEYPQISIKIGLEFEYIPGQEEKIRSIIDEYSFDYTIGSVHFLDSWNFDHPDYIEEYEKRTLIDLYREYFETVYKCVSTGLFQITGHLDLIKVFNYKLEFKKIRELVDPVLNEIKKQEMAIEINAGGLYKPVKEIYPSLEIIKMSIAKNIPLTISSDAHRFDEVGRDNQFILNMLKDLGVNKIAGFSHGSMYEISI